MKIQIKKLSENAIIPTRASAGAAGYDLYSTEDCILNPGERHLFKTNLSIQIPPGYYGRIAPRSGLALKQGIDVLAGVIDEDYAGDVGVILLNTAIIPTSLEIYPYYSLYVRKGDRIAQIIFEKYHEVEFEEVNELTETARGENGWGSTG